MRTGRAVGRPGRLAIGVALAGLAVLAAACGTGAAAGGPDRADRVRLGYFPNITHASALIGVEKGLFADRLGAGVRLEPRTFNAGPAAVEALFSGAVDAAYIGPNPAITAWARSHGKAIKIVSGAASGGAALVVKAGITSAADLRGKRIASPQLGNTQDVALRFWLRSQGLRTDTRGGGDVAIVPQENSQTLATFATGDIDGAWVPEPFVSRLVLESGGRVLVDEKDLWPGGRFVVTHLVVRTDFLERHPDLVARLVEGQVAANDVIARDRDAAAATANAALARLTGRPLPGQTLDRVFAGVEFTNDPLPATLAASADHAAAVGLLEPVDLRGIYALDALNQILRARGEEGV